LKILALDIGEKRVGLAVSDELGMTASPFKTIQRKEAVSEIAEIVIGEGVGKVVVGVPYLASGELGSQATDVWKFIEELKPRVSVEIDFENEILTSYEAEERLKDKKKKNKEDIDSMAAVIILESYLARTKNE
jgi:putative Holliday junction resolvase